MNMKRYNDQKEKIILSANDLQSMGFGRQKAYELLKRSDLPVVKIGNRVFMHRDLFLKWLEEQASMKDETK